MASLLPRSLLLLLGVLLSAVLAASDATSAKLAALRPIADAGTNSEMQDLGRFAVDEYNHKRQDESSPPVTFSAVSSASQRQVTTGDRYYLEVVTTVDAVSKVFDGVVQVNTDKSRELVSFELVEDPAQ